MIVTLTLMQNILKVLPAIALAPESVSKLVTEGAGDVGKKQQSATPPVVKLTVLTTLVEWHDCSHELTIQ